jgi:transcriptional regulator with XRE-family HTH domain
VVAKSKQQLIEALREWCDGARGRRVAIAKALGVSRQSVNHWLKGTQGPTANQSFAILEFLNRRRRSERLPRSGDQHRNAATTQETLNVIDYDTECVVGTITCDVLRCHRMLHSVGSNGWKVWETLTTKERKELGLESRDTILFTRMAS